jgi:hypothetical protein
MPTTDPKSRPVRWSDDLLRYIWAARRESHPVPAPGIFDAPFTCVQINTTWASHVIGAIDILSAPDAWRGGDSEVWRAQQEIERLLREVAVGLCDSEGNEMPLRQNPDNPCILQQSYDGGATWVNVFDFSLCQPSSIERSVTTYNQYQEIINQGNTYLETITNNYNGTPSSVVPDLVAQNVDTLDEALCYACHHIIGATCDAALGFYDEMSSQGNLLFGAAAIVGAALAFIALPGISVPILGAILSGSTLFASVTINFLETHQTGPFESQAARDEAACCLFDKLRGSVPTEAEFTQAALDCKAELSGDAHIIVDWLTDSLFLNAETSQEFYLSFLKLAEEGVRPVELGLWSCPCNAEIVLTLSSKQLNTFEVAAGVYEITATGLWSINGEAYLYNADGVPNSSGNANVYLPSANTGALIARSVGGWELIGTGPTTFESDGSIDFIINDRPGYFSDNQGELTVTLTRQA